MSALNVGPLAREDAPRLMGPAIAVEKLADRGGDTNFRSVNPQHVDLGDREGSGGQAMQNHAPIQVLLRRLWSERVGTIVSKRPS